MKALILVLAVCTICTKDVERQADLGDGTWDGLGRAGQRHFRATSYGLRAAGHGPWYPANTLGT